MANLINNSFGVPTETFETLLTRALQGLRYGSVEIIVHDAKIVQLERKEKFRLEESSAPQVSNISRLEH
jgi:hypothetical protein